MARMSQEWQDIKDTPAGNHIKEDVPFGPFQVVVVCYQIHSEIDFRAIICFISLLLVPGEEAQCNVSRKQVLERKLQALENDKGAVSAEVADQTAGSD